MCDHNGDDQPGRACGDPAVWIDPVAVGEAHADPAPPLIDRREFNGLLVASATVATIAGTARLFTGGSAPAEAVQLPPIQSYDGLWPIASAMHIHSAFSEQHASLEAQMSEAFANNTSRRLINPGSFVLWQTEHDWREAAHAAPTHIAFTGLSQELVGGKPLVWQERNDSSEISAGGVLAASAFEIVVDPASPYDTSPGRGAMHLMSRGGNVNPISVLAYANFNASRLSQRTNLAGQTLIIDLLPRSADGTNGYLELRLALSYRPALNGRPAGQYMLSYRFASSASGYETSQILGIVHRRVQTDMWQRVQLNPINDIRHLWPDLIAEDNSLQDIWLGATSVNARAAEGYFGNLHFFRTRTSQADVRATQQGIREALAGRYPGVVLPRGREISYFERHINAFGSGADYRPDYNRYPDAWPNGPGWEETTAYARAVQANGGLVSFNHPFGTSATTPGTASNQGIALLRVFTDTHAHDICGADILEVGFQERGGTSIVGGTTVIADLDHHLALWDMHSRNSRWITGTGVSDDHTGGVGQWVKSRNRFLTYPWAATHAEEDLLASLSAGRVFVGELGTFTGLLDIQVDGVVAMGQVSVRPDLSRRTLKVIAIGLPAESSVRVVQGPIDNPGAATAGPGTVVVATLPSSAFLSGSTTVSINTGRSSFARLEVITGSARTVAFSNPIYLLVGPPARPIPVNRIAADSVLT